MKSSSILSLVTAAALVTTIGTSFAAWDVLSSTATPAGITIANKTEVTADATEINWSGANGTSLANTGVVGGSDKITGKLTVTVKGGTEDKMDLALTTKDIKIDGTDVTDKVNIVFTDDNEGNKEVNNTDKDDTLTETNTYTVTVTPKDGADLSAYASKQLTFDITATATAKTETPAA